MIRFSALARPLILNSLLVLCLVCCCTGARADDADWQAGVASVKGEALGDTIAYTRSLQDQLVGGAIGALAQMPPAKLAWGSGVASFAMNRRQFTDRGVILGVNPRGMVDRTVPVLRVDGPDG